MVQHPRQYPWSSYRINAEGKKSDLIAPQDEYLRLGRNKDERKESYRGLFKAYIDPDVLSKIRKSTNGNYVLGSERFQEDIGNMLKRRVVPGKPGRPILRGV